MTELRKNLTTELRPRRFSEVIGHDQVISELQNLFATSRQRALMFSGPPGTGKTTFAHIIARSVNCDHAEFGEPCDACLETVFDIRELNMADTNGIDDARALFGDDLSVYPMTGNMRVFILDECQMMTKQAQSLLLKPLERAATFNLFIFCTTDPQKIEQTVKDRCYSFKLKGLNDNDIARLVDAVLWQCVDATEPGALEPFKPLIEKLREREITSPRNIVMAVEKMLAGVPVEDAAVVESACKVSIPMLCGALVRGNWSEAQKLLADAEPKSRDYEDIRRGLVGYCRNQMLKATTPARAKAFSDAIFELTDHQHPMEYGQALAVVVASVYRACLVMQMAARQAKAA